MDPSHPTVDLAGGAPSWARWREHFERNARRPLPAGLEQAAGQTADWPAGLQEALAASLARFQRGETGEGRIAHQVGQAIEGLDPDYRIALRLLMREEGRHAQVLAASVRALGGELVGGTWTHSLFVGARRLWGAKLKLLVLLSAEAIGASFYQLLSERLPAGALRQALAEIHRDEEHHLEFHCQFFGQQVGREPLARLRFQAVFRAVGHAAAAVVALDHRRTFETLGLSSPALLSTLVTRLSQVEARVLAPRPAANDTHPTSDTHGTEGTAVPVADRPAATPTRSRPDELAPPAELARQHLPRHVAVIMDGNGRWAELRGHPRIEGHRQGVRAVREVVRASRELGLEALTLYAFSSLNWQRPRAEVQALMGLLERYLVDERQEIMEQGIRLCSIGDKNRLPAFVRRPLEALQELSAGNRQMTLCLALSYGGRESLVEASQRLAREVAAGKLRPEDIDAGRFGLALDTAQLPEVDLVIRTSGEQRLSNFLLWEAAQAELYFSPELWPDFDRRDLWEALLCYQRRERRLGMTSAQLASQASERAAPRVA